MVNEVNDQNFEDEVIKSAMLANAHSFILVHNHPSGDQHPTKEDHYITEALIEVSRLMQSL